MSTRIIDNSIEYLRQFHGPGLSSKTNVLTIQNLTPYAIYLQEKIGYYVIDLQRAGQIVDETVKAFLRLDIPITKTTLENALEEAAEIIVKDLQRFTGRLKPPVKAGNAERPAHPGSWADITTKLASSYTTKVNSNAQIDHPYDGERQD